MGKAKLTKEKIIATAARLFAQNGVKATSVRRICSEAGVTHNMVGHHFGGKDGLVNELIHRYATGLFAGALRIIEEPIRDTADFETRFRLFQKESLASALENRYLILIFISLAGQDHYPSYNDALAAASLYQKSALAFLQAGQAAGAVRKDADVEMLAAAIWDRILTQVRYLDWLKEAYGDNNVANPEFRNRWLNANVDTFLFGITPRGSA